MDRRALIISGLAAAGTGAYASASRAQSQPYSSQPYSPPPASQPYSPPPPRSYPGQPGAPQDGGPAPSYPSSGRAETYTRDETVNAVSDFMGVTAESAGAAVERAFRENGQPTAYLAGQEGSAAFLGGVRYGKGLLYMKNRPTQEVYWQGPSIGWDWGGNASRVFTLCYGLQYPDAVFRRFPGVEGSAYFVGGLGVNYQRADDITLAPIRAGLGLRLGANIGYLSYSRTRHILPI
ncbi:DUF1134 domain-containing protein [Caulobacter sp. CCUG 60055]|uniref:DUF1134 domain-containing protein n=1 Tax=Caulobacter sp. CCUG 60055 TaxID=2100090 RepID=UPI001FA6B3F3|nr:DUF1134 domain-containing protein [Caulobacter sp. CCUG 60055]MBQ1542455.1 DUF1134 domain-containing protein [Caulobacteraceae bacterium]MCI3180966.1 DUF1134 domain-containing protein [Caulobacter sp. CCUG 60055]